jgi:urease accessory protein
VSVAGLLLGDSRFPAGGHAHSGGVEPAVTAGTVTGLDSLELFLHGRLRTSGLVAAAVAAAACAHVAACAHAAVREPRAGEESAAPVTDHFWSQLDAETDARTPSPAQREASRRQGRALLRAARTAWPEAGWLAELAAGSRNREPGKREYRGGAHHAVVLGAAAAAAGCDPGEAARIAAYQAVAGPVSAAVRLLALDPMRATGVLAGLTADIGQVAEQAAAYASGPPCDLPCPSAPALDLLAEAHIRAEVRLFES